MRSVLVSLNGDVIHSFWVPRITRKNRCDSGQPNYIRIEANRVGVYSGQCAEFCGDQHGHMGMLLVAQTQSAYDKRLADLRQLGTMPTRPLGPRLPLLEPCLHHRHPEIRIEFDVCRCNSQRNTQRVVPLIDENCHQLSYRFAGPLASAYAVCRSS